MPVYPPLQESEPKVYTAEDFAAWEDAMQRLAVIDATLKRFERCKMPCDAQRADCDALCTFFQTLIQEYRGPHSPFPQG